MNRLTIYFFTVSCLFFGLLDNVQAQFNVKVTVNSGSSTTTCTDVIGAPDPQWAININNAGWEVYPFNGLCFNNLPNVQFDQTYTCAGQVPPTLQVCFRAFENDASIFDPCNPVLSCAVETCLDLPIPFVGSMNYDLQLPDGQGSDGTANITIAVSGVPNAVSDNICNAIPLGQLVTEVTVGDADTSMFDNICATGTNEPNPGTLGGTLWNNNAGVWFSFQTGPTPRAFIEVIGKSDPSGFGDPINMQLAVFKSLSGTCAGPFEFVTENHEGLVSWDEYTPFVCPEPNTTYYILIDGVVNTPEQVEGVFGLQVTELDIQQAPDNKCMAENLGTVPLGGMVSPPSLRLNSCSSNATPQPNSSFSVEKSVWFTFTPPPTGHVIINGISNNALDPVSLQLAVFETSNGNCNSIMTEVDSKYTANTNDESLELHCLDPNKTYYVMVDGANNALRTGVFDLQISDAGDETPKTVLNPIICAGESFVAGLSTYTQSGSYTDTLQLAGGCDSIVYTNLTVLAPMQPSIQVIQQGVGLGNTSGQIMAGATGGSGAYSYLWSTGETTATVANLVGGDNYCVTISDQQGCSADTCFAMPYYIHFVPQAEGDSLACNGGIEGQISFTAVGGQPPYNFSWQNSTATVSGSGLIVLDGQNIQLDNLPAGSYAIHLFDALFDTTVIVEIWEPTQLAVSSFSVTDATCFGGCDGTIDVAITGGTAPYQVIWSNGESGENLPNLCAGNYAFTVTDDNGCTDSYSYAVSQPVEFEAAASLVNSVSCFGGSDGAALVTSNGNAVNYVWSNGATTPDLSDVPGGTYAVTVTNASGCTDVASVTVPTPNAPVEVSVQQVQGIVCQGDETGSLQALVSGPGADFNFNWSTGSQASSASSLGAGTYHVTVANELGCSASASFVLSEPAQLLVDDVTTNEITCLDPPNAGIITVGTVSGGTGNAYTFSNDGFSFSADTDITGYGAGPQTFYVQDAGGCVQTFTATIPGPEELLLELESQIQIELGEAVELSPVSNQAGLVFAWSPSASLSCTDCENPVAQPFDNEVFSLTVTDAFGCTASAEVAVFVKKSRNVFIPNVFSPDGDGINDEFLPFPGTSTRLIKQFRVFDRQGNLVFEARDFLPGGIGSGWDGTFRGKEMQPAVFVWYAEVEFLDGEKEIFKGDVTLLR